jgi:hypothetical protein
MEKSDHNKIIKSLATKLLKPYGIKRKGQSRTFIDDHGWYYILIEFQPSSWNRGTYLNIGVDFNWYLDEYLGFSFYSPGVLGARESELILFVDEEQFSNEIIKLCEIVIERVHEYRNLFKDLKYAEKTLIKHYFPNTDLFWGNYNRGIISGLNGKKQNFNKYFNKVLAAEDKREWCKK